MSYTEPVTFTRTGQYGCGPDDEDDVYTVEEFKVLCASRGFVDYDGHGYPVKEKMADRECVIKPSRVEYIPADATHVVWYNK